MSDQKEVDRLQRLREQQLRARDPTKKERQQAKMISQKYQRRKKLTLVDALKEVRGGWWGTLVGGLLGAILGLLVQQELEASAAIFYILLFAGLIIGRMVGMVADWRDEDHGQIRRGR